MFSGDVKHALLTFQSWSMSGIWCVQQGRTICRLLVYCQSQRCWYLTVSVATHNARVAFLQVMHCRRRSTQVTLLDTPHEFGPCVSFPCITPIRDYKPRAKTNFKASWWQGYAPLGVFCPRRGPRGKTITEDRTVEWGRVHPRSAGRGVTKR